MLIACVAYLASLLLAVAACYGAYNLYSRGWPHALYQTILMFLRSGHSFWQRSHSHL
ncbi:hypothetical protein [Rhodopirellula europaea]|uniref:hypothetical protein n=1 Tax=Rhodopirellula europaea TaxID=1263866 RepID=UPI001360B298|nr:hypothetical protein [Rhodopirellula europaea]